MKVLAIPGSLRRASLNAALLRALARVSPTDIEVAVYTRLGELPLFNPDIEKREPEAVADLRDRLVASDAVVVASPEYAHGVTGVMKNALDWMVGNESFVQKPVAILNASPRASHADASLREIVSTMSGRIVERASVTLPILGFKFNEEDMVRDAGIRAALNDVVVTLKAAVGASAHGRDR